HNGLAEVAQQAWALPAAGSFAALDAASQIAVMQGLEIAQPEFFEAARVATITAMFANPEYGGNQDKAGWRLIGFEDRFIWQPPFGYYDREETR
ncbi:MAG: gluconate 2-dehydrogenase subunit 3 family protein, partial [Gemmatimonadales bacterium]